jgi:hypothetical protein
VGGECEWGPDRVKGFARFNFLVHAVPLAWAWSGLAMAYCVCDGVQLDGRGFGVVVYMDTGHISGSYYVEWWRLASLSVLEHLYGGNPRMVGEM